MEENKVRGEIGTYPKKAGISSKKGSRTIVPMTSNNSTGGAFALGNTNVVSVLNTSILPAPFKQTLVVNRFTSNNLFDDGAQLLLEFFGSLQMWQAQLPTTTGLLRGKHNNIPPTPRKLKNHSKQKRRNQWTWELFYKLTSSQNNELKVFLVL